MRAFKLTLLAIFLFTVVSMVNRILYKRTIKHLPKSERKKKMAEYDRQDAMALDACSNRAHRTFWNTYLKKPEGYSFGVEGEMISSALGKNEHDKTLSEKGKGKLSSWFYGIKLVKILDKLDKNHCINSIDLTKGEWQPKIK